MSIIKLEKYNCSERLILTPNARISLSTQECFIKEKSRTHRAFAPLNIMPLPVFIAKAWQQFQAVSNTPNARMLTPLELNHLFTRAIESVSPELPLSYSLLEEVKRAWNHSHLWNLPINDEHFSYTLETETFQKWSEALDALKGEKIAPVEAYQRMTQELDKLKDFLPKEILLMHFESLSPVENEFFSALTSVCVVENFEPERQVSRQCSRLSFDDLSSENEGLVQWIQQKLDEGQQNIGVVVGALATRKERLSELFHQHFPAELINISIGRPLSDYPLTSTALTILKSQSTRRLSKETLLLLLKSPFIKVGDERAQRLAFADKLESLNALSFSHQDILKQSTCPLFNELLSDLQANTISGLQTPSAWGQKLKEILIKLSFPGEAPLSSHNYQLFEKFNALLDEIANLDDTTEKLSFQQYVDLFKMSLDLTLFQPQRRKEVRVHVLGLLEGLSLSFDSLWLMGVNDTLLPETLKLSPFIPPHIQRERQMPKSNLQNEIVYAKRLIDKFKQAAPEVCFSLFLQEAGNEYRPSPLISDLPEGIKLSAPYKKKTVLSHIENNYVSQETLPETFVANSALLKEQADCPFRAYAKFRLRLTPKALNQYGLTPMARGILLHRVLEHFWQSTRTQERLLTLNDTTLYETLQTSVQRALKETPFEQFEILGSQFKTLEEERLIYLCQKWLALEKERPPFEVLACEQKETFTLKGLPFSLRIDRIDKSLSEDATLLIDYKSGISSPGKWFEEPLSEPQLPLYALCVNEADALVFFQLKPSDLAIRGISREESAEKGLKPIEKAEKRNWTQQKALWQEQIESLVDEFKAGHFEPKPKHSSLCGECEYKRLCRQAEG